MSHRTLGENLLPLWGVRSALLSIDRLQTVVRVNQPDLAILLDGIEESKTFGSMLRHNRVGSAA